LSKDNLSFAKRVEKLFAGKDHVGIVKHYEGIEIDKFIEYIHEILESQSIKYEDAIEDIKDKINYNCVGIIDDKKKLFLWIRAIKIDFGILAEIKLYHPTELSSFSDEFLSNLVYNLENKLFNYNF